jgi:predicted AAA+ superfamily ATPase
MLDEIQLVENFADVLNEFLRKDNVDIYVTGSNARLLSKDVITEFRGRGHEIKMYPLSFAEYTSVNKSSLPLALDDYETYGGLPQIFDYSTEEEKSALPVQNVRQNLLKKADKGEMPCVWLY